MRGRYPQSAGYNPENGESCKFDQPTDKLNTDPLLQPLAANGGLTSTRLPDPNGPVAEAGGPGQYLPKGLETQVILNAPVDVAARVVDSGGFVMAKSMVFAKTLALSFKAAPFAGAAMRVGPAVVASAVSQATPEAPNGLAAEDTRYYLEIVPAANVDINQEYDLTMDTQTAVVQSGLKLYLPLVWK